jgi:hypothetical protein
MLFAILFKVCVVPAIFNNLSTILLILAGGGEWAERLTIHLNCSPFIDSHCISSGEDFHRCWPNGAAIAAWMKVQLGARHYTSAWIFIVHMVA